MMRKWLTLTLIAMFSVINAQEKGLATYYGDKHHGRKSADGSVFNQHALTCAAPVRYAFGTILKVTNLENDKTTTCKVTDRGGFERLGRLIDLSKGAFSAISSLSKGVIRVKVEVVE